MKKFQAIAREQSARAVDQAARLATVPPPKQGWIRTVRSALAMSGTALAKRLGVRRSAVSNLERAEREGRITLHKLSEAAEAMGCRVVYAIVPRDADSIHALLHQQASRRAAAIVARATEQMALEDQALSAEEAIQEVERLTAEYLSDHPYDLWME